MMDFSLKYWVSFPALYFWSYAKKNGIWFVLIQWWKLWNLAGIRTQKDQILSTDQKVSIIFQNHQNLRSFAMEISKVPKRWKNSKSLPAQSIQKLEAAIIDFKIFLAGNCFLTELLIFALYSTRAWNGNNQWALHFLREKCLHFSFSAPPKINHSEMNLLELLIKNIRENLFFSTDQFFFARIFLKIWQLCYNFHSGKNWNTRGNPLTN
jgi:hypothetical protein